MITEFENRSPTVLVTGGASGIGYATVRRFVSEGWNILCHYYSSDKQAKNVQIEACDFGVKCDLIKADLSSEVGIKYLIDNVKNQVVDSLINNAASYIVQKHFSELEIDEISRSIFLNLTAPFLLSSAIFPSMYSRGFGRIVNISSIAAKYGGSPLSMHYGCSKCGMEGITLTLAREGAAHGVLVNTIRPGVIDTPFHKKFQKDMKKRLELNPARRMGTAKDVADMIYYLGSNANNYINGQTVAISGGE